MQRSEENILNNLTKINTFSEMRKYHVRNFGNLNKIDKFLEKYNSLELTQEEIKSMYNLITI